MSNFINYMDYFITTNVLDKEYGDGSNMVMCGYIWISHTLGKKEEQIIPVYGLASPDEIAILLRQYCG